MTRNGRTSQQSSVRPVYKRHSETWTIRVFVKTGPHFAYCVESRRNEAQMSDNKNNKSTITALNHNHQQ
jgi:hypothetical protein